MCPFPKVQIKWKTTSLKNNSRKVMKRRANMMMKVVLVVKRSKKISLRILVCHQKEAGLLSYCMTILMSLTKNFLNVFLIWLRVDNKSIDFLELIIQKILNPNIEEIWDVGIGINIVEANQFSHLDRIGNISCSQFWQWMELFYIQ